MQGQSSMLQLKAAKTELKHLQEVLSQCVYPKWAINKVLQQQEERHKKQKKARQKQHQPAKQKCHSGSLFPGPV